MCVSGVCGCVCGVVWCGVMWVCLHPGVYGIRVLHLLRLPNEAR